MKHGKTNWGNLQRCGSVWSCPVCAKQITEERRVEMGQLIKYWEQQENSDIKLMTLTFSHSKDEPLKVLLRKLKNAITMFLVVGSSKIYPSFARFNTKSVVLKSLMVQTDGIRIFIFFY
ncbi:hypothetical protein [Acinetobacter seifertii]|uniref:hypothetical protein n=1 Tax=Acinetobacter seifertii TaxID=1530123 RepID=UPI0027DB04F5|nr:hypothetical protein [Acinetobacter seifertii]